jgi:hypothetical protein
MLYCEMLYLQMGKSQSDLLLGEAELAPSWRQTNRWIRYEQAVEGEGTRFCKSVIGGITKTTVLSQTVR